ncbi:hypothetical protein QJS10_CPB18g00796 [Acorus calamus]|uniref:Uncharacterized protein n=1 Tax=Acorus calamus TaxID=4465 RepID=A0AAV9CQF5_ACOCL|nr:hypothetical protein QJS10_CPB18g00796 [Acorus calamus]
MKEWPSGGRNECADDGVSGVASAVRVEKRLGLGVQEEKEEGRSQDRSGTEEEEMPSSPPQRRSWMLVLTTMAVARRFKVACIGEGAEGGE